MAYSHDILPFSWPASADLSAHQYKFVTLNSNEKLALADATVPVLGILNDAPDAVDIPGSVMVLGIARLRVNAGTTNIAPMDRLAPDANGFGVKTTLDNDEMGAIALEAATANDVIIAALVVTGLRV